MTRSTLKHTIIATATAGALITTPALARPAADPATGPTGNGTIPRQDLRGADARDTGRLPASPAAPTWPEHPKPLTRAETPVAVSTSDGDGNGIWLILGLGVGGALVAGGAAGLSRHSRVRARRVAV